MEKGECPGRKTHDAVSPAEQLQARVSAMVEERHALAAKFESLLWRFSAYLAWPKK